MAPAAASNGNQTQTISDPRTVKPLEVNSGAIPRGATSMGRTGAKNLWSEKGHKNAMPRPPLVNASRIPCEAAAANTKQNARLRLEWSARAKAAPTAAMTRANINE